MCLKAQHLHGLGLLLVLTAVVTNPLQAQDVDEQAVAARHRNNCRLAGQVVTTGEPHAKMDWAEAYIGMCPQEAPAIFARRWLTVPGDTHSVAILLHRSARFEDARIYEQLRRTVLDRSRPAVVRVGAMLVLVRYVDPHNAAWFNDLIPPPDPIRYIRVPLSSALHPVSYPGTSPLPATRSRRVARSGGRSARNRVAHDLVRRGVTRKRHPALSPEVGAFPSFSELTPADPVHFEPEPEP